MNDSTDLLLDQLYNLSIRLSHTGGTDRGMNVIEAYNHFITNSDRGRACTYAMRCKSMFMSGDFHDCKKLIESILELMEGIENEG